MQSPQDEQADGCNIACDRNCEQLQLAPMMVSAFRTEQRDVMSTPRLAPARSSHYPWLLSFALALAVGLLLAGCSSNSARPGSGEAGTSDDFTANDGKLTVATTVAPLTNIVLNIGGDRIHIHGLIPDGVDSHTFEPKPSDAEVLSRASMLIMNGAHLEGSTEKVAMQNLKDKSKIYHLADNTLSGDAENCDTCFLYDFSFPREKGDPNPHLWMNPQYAMKYAQLTEGWLEQNDPKNAAYYQQNLAQYLAVLKQLDDGIAQAVQTVPQAQRKLLTYHDSWAYWARRYGWQVIGAIQPSDFKEPSAQEVARLIDQIKQQQVPAIFGSEVFPSKVLNQIASETHVKYVTSLRDDEPPGAKSAPQHTYVGMLLDDMRAMLPALGGNADALSGIKPDNTFTTQGTTQGTAQGSK
jgi:manganese/iron transport system substrate-binding protein